MQFSMEWCLECFHKLVFEACYVVCNTLAIYTIWWGLSFWDCSRVGRLERWVTIFLPARNCVLVWLCLPGSDECLCCWRAQSNPQDGTNYSLPDIARDHHLHISTVTIMTSQGPMGGVGMLWYGALESLWQHNLDKHTDLTFTLDNQGFLRVLKWNIDLSDDGFICPPWCENSIYPILLLQKFALSHQRDRWMTLGPMTAIHSLFFDF